MPRGDSYQLQGLQGGVVLAAGDSTDVGDEFRWIQFLDDTVIDYITSNIENDAELAGPTFGAGTGFGGIITSVALISGLAIVYKR